MNDPRDSQHPPRAGDDAAPHEDRAPDDDDEVMLVLGSSHDSVTEFNELLDSVPDQPEDALDH